MSGWMLPKLTDYWDQQAGTDFRSGAVFRTSRRLERLSARELDENLLDLEAAVVRHVRALDDTQLLTAATCVMDDLYKAVAKPVVWDDCVGHYLDTTGSAFFREVALRGYEANYAIHNYFASTPLGMKGPAEFFRFWFNTAGLLYICPQQIALLLMGNDGLALEDFNAAIPRYIDEARLVAQRGLAEAHERRRHYVYLDADGTDESFSLPLSRAGQAGILLMFRTEAPTKGGKVAVWRPETPWGG